jgi:hypothetical protein
MLESQALGCFLVRENTTSRGEFVLSIRSTATVEHVRIIKGREGFGLGMGMQFPSVDRLVEYGARLHHGFHHTQRQNPRPFT